MNPIIIACKTIENELHAAMAQTGCHFPVLWLESGLHNVPKLLHEKLQELLDGCQGYDTVLLAMGFCGNSVVGLQTRDFRMILPRCDDCITLLLGSQERRQEAKATFFMTEGWLKGERNIWVEHEACMEKYGPKRGKRIFDALFAHYKYVALVDTGAYETAKAEEETLRIADALGMEFRHMDGTLEYLCSLLKGNWTDDRFVILPPQSTLPPSACTIQHTE